ncbi:MAG: efflux RND transporter periplasmic adaptor subunit [Chloroflexi bacterium]|nr:efflux RND transporter periplasmic adaptor subunit [Chloroflexota bacterium]
MSRFAQTTARILTTARATYQRLSPRQRALGVGAVAALLALGAWALLGETRSPSAEAESPEEHAGEAEDLVVLDSIGMAAAGLRIATVSAGGVSQHVASGTVTYNLNRVSLVAPRAEGRVVRVLSDLGRSVGAGQPLALLESSEVGALRGDLDRARADLEVSRAALERERALYERKITSRRELEDAEAEYQRAAADLRAAQAALRALGAGASGQGAAFAVASPIAGVVVTRRATPGQVAGPADTLFTVADLDPLWVELDLYEKDLGEIRAGQRLALTTTAFGDSTYDGTITYVGQIVDPRTRTIKVRAEVANPGGTLRPGMFVTARIRDVVQPDLLTVPGTAVQVLEDRDVVFVPVGANRFRATPVMLGERFPDGRVAVTAGLRAGQRIVAEGSFSLKSELEKESFGGDHH